IRMDSVCVEPSKKLIIGLNADYLPSVKQSDTLSQYETDLINKYMITMDNNFGNKMAVIRQNENVFLLNPNALGKSKILTGPLKDNYATFDLQGESPRFFLTEPGYSYLFEPGLLRQTSIPTKYPFNQVLSSSPGIDDYTQYAITQARADSIWQQYLDLRNSSEELFENKPANTSQTGQLVFKREVAKNENPVLIKNIIIYKNGDPDFALIYAGKTTTFNNLAGGTYRLLFLLQGDSYDIRENINIKPHGINYYGMRVLPTHLKDSVSLKINKVINSRSGRHDYTDYDIRNDALKIKEAFNEKYFNTSGFTLQVSGVVTSSDDRTPLPGVSIIIKGTNVGSVTDTEGKFTLKVPSTGKLIISYVGFISQEAEIVPGTSLNIKLIVSAKELKEVVVIGYGVQKRSELTGSVSVVNSMLMGQAAGLMVVPGSPGGGASIRIRGVSEIAGKEPLYVVDGVVVNNLGGIDPAAIADISILKDAAATALYGARAANGAIIIATTKKQNNNPGVPQQSSEQSIRKNFSDYAYWQPKLTTDENGKASFTSVFPDDITNWRTFVIGINGSRQSGFAENQIKSFKPLSASFLAPLFAVEGDELNALGKITNYNTDAAKLTRTFTYNGKQIKQDNLEVSNAKIDTLNLPAANTDS
ncbi:MAG: carboxypeptidase-like regulatory domain-containing protein, partial [Mucilaginibacter sp.]